MFGMTVRNSQDLIKYLNTKQADLDKLLSKFDADRNAGTITHFMHWSGADLHRASVHADHANKYITYLEKENTNTPIEEKYEMIKNDVEHKIENMTMSFLSTSSNPAERSEKMYEMAFYLELKAAMKVY